MDRSTTQQPSGAYQTRSSSRSYQGVHQSTEENPLESPPLIIASSSRAPPSYESLYPSPPVRHMSDSTRPTERPIMMELPTSISSSSIESSPYHEPSSRRLFHDTPTTTQTPSLPGLVSPMASSSLQNEVRTPTAHGHGGDDQDVFGKIDHTPLRQETHSTSPLPNSRSLQMGDLLDHVLDADQFQRLSVGNIIAPERGSSKKPPKRLPTDPHSTTASPTPLSRSTARTRSALTSITPNKNVNASSERMMTSSPASDPFMPRSSYPSSDELSLHVKHHMAALQESPQTH